MFSTKLVPFNTYFVLNGATIVLFGTIWIYVTIPLTYSLFVPFHNAVYLRFKCLKCVK